MLISKPQAKSNPMAMPALLLLAAALGFAAAGWAGQENDNRGAAVNPGRPPNPFRTPRGAVTPMPSQESGESPTGTPKQGTEAESSSPTLPSLPATANGRRDPFKAWVTPAPAGHTAASEPKGILPAGIKGLVISQLRLEGVVHQPSANTMLAVVTNSSKRAYFLRVNDTVHNGVVSRITPDAVYFNEKTVDWSGRAVTHEVALKLGSAPGERR
jgi:hypothetical protein